jgi:hypothetical protein
MPGTLLGGNYDYFIHVTLVPTVGAGGMCSDIGVGTHDILLKDLGWLLRLPFTDSLMG